VWRVHPQPGVSPDRTYQPVIPRAQWLRLATDEADAALLRADARRNLLAVARVIGWSANRSTGRSRPTLARIVTVTGLSLRTVQRWCRFLEQRGLLAVLEPGVTAQYRPAILALGTGSLAREWQLMPPLVKQTVTPPFGVVLDLGSQRSRAHEHKQADRRSAADSTPPPSLPQLIPWPPGQNPQRRREALAAAEQVRRDLPVLRRMSARAVRSAVRVYFRAGWTPADVAYALDHLPDGSRHIRTDAVRSPARWLAWRLGLWRSADGTPLRSHSAELAERAGRHRAELADLRVLLVNPDAASPARAASHKAAIRQMLAERAARPRPRPGPTGPPG
jgi:hypothetical protein